MFESTKTNVLNATAVLPLSEKNLEFLKAIQLRHINEIPEGATHIAFLEDGDACWLNDFEVPRIEGSFLPQFPAMTFVTFYENIPIQFDE